MPEESALDPDSIANEIISGLSKWTESKRRRQRIDANVLCAGLYVAEHLGLKFPLERSDYLTKSQVKGAGGAQAALILARHGEFRKFLAEAGRTSRATFAHAQELVGLISESEYAYHLSVSSDEERKQIASLVQAWFVKQIQVEYFAKERVKAEISHDKPVRLAVGRLIAAAQDRGGNAAGAVAQHLVGAKLALRFPAMVITNNSSTTADKQTSRPGDFLVGDTAIHVTMSPKSELFDGVCVTNLANGYRPRVLVPEGKLEAARQMCEDDRVAVGSIEDFVGTNVEEMASFDGDQIKSGLRLLLEKYNERVQQIETDPGLLIEVPTNL